MEFLHNGFTLELCEGAFPLSTDSMVLSGFVHLPRQAKVLDLGSGCGTLGLMLCANDPTCTVTGVEINADAHSMALYNSRANNITDRLTSICGDLQSVPSLFSPGSFDCCISNPPYFPPGSQNTNNTVARHETACTLQELFRSAAWAIRYGGDFFLVHKPERLAELCAYAAAVQLEPKRLQLIRHRPDDPINLVLLQCRKGGKPGLIIEENTLKDRFGSPSDFYRKLYHI